MKLIKTLIIISLLSLGLLASTTSEQKPFLSTSAFVLANFAFPDLNFFQLNYGYSLSEKDVLIIEAITWSYDYPLGIPFGDDFDSEEYKYPGKIQEFGIGLAYQRFLCKSLYAMVHATPFLQHYLNEDGETIQKGFQLFTTLRLGWHFQVWEDRLFIEPSIAVTYWPVNTKVPSSFKTLESDWPNYFLFEPGVHIGYYY